MCRGAQGSRRPGPSRGTTLGAVHVFGLTGGLATGKSTVVARLRARGLPVVDADVLARKVVEPGSPGLAEVVSAFGERAL
ncbi:MAG TPA: dephospho-CoA kinase, partial [Polyangiaceae bacterium]